jgi:hypothetical protein
MATLTFHEKTNTFSITLEKEKANWLLRIIDEITLNEFNKTLLVNDLKNSFESYFDDFELFWYSKPVQLLKENGVLLVL